MQIQIGTGKHESMYPWVGPFPSLVSPFGLQAQVVASWALGPRPASSTLLISLWNFFYLEFSFHYSTMSAKSLDTRNEIHSDTPANIEGAKSWLLLPKEASSWATLLQSRGT